MLTKKTTRPPPRVAVYWLTSRDDNGRSETLTMGRGGERRLPVFSFREEAEMFLSLRTLGAGWSVKQTTAGELVSVLMGPYSGVEFVALDPMPELVCRGMADLVSMSRERFINRFVEKAGSEKPEPPTL